MDKERRLPFETARFHASAGPQILFDRAHFIFREPRRLKLAGRHFQERTVGKNIPREALEMFESEKWELMNIEVRTDTYKFVGTAWRRLFDARCWWLAIGLHDTVKTMFVAPQHKIGMNSRIVTGGELYERVRFINQELMDNEPASPVM